MHHLQQGKLSKLINSIGKVKPADPRVLSVAKIHVLSPNECFSVDEDDRTRCILQSIIVTGGEGF